MSSNKQIIDYCPNYYKIINFNPIMEDGITSRIISMYQEYIFNIDLNSEEDINEIKELDAALAKYIDDYSFRKEVQRQIREVKVKKDAKNIIKAFIEAIIRIFVNYEDYTTRVIYISRWI